VTLPALPPGHVVAGKYSIRALLGHVGVSATYHAQNAQAQDVALKLYDPAIAGHQAVMKGLEAAYAATNALPAHAAAPILDAGYDPQTTAPFTVTGLIPLPSLRSMSRRMSADEVVALVQGLARSVDLAHLRQVVHGALKPSNVFVGPSCNPVIVTDFAANLPKGAIPTQEGFVASAPWIAPEQAQGGAEVTGAADVFSAGLLVFFALTGRSFWRSCQYERPDVAAWQQELTAQRMPFSARAAEIGVPVTPAIDSVMWKALAAHPHERYRSIGELAGALAEAFRREQPPAATMALPAFAEPAPQPQPSAPAQENYPPPPPQAPPMPPARSSNRALPVVIALGAVAVIGAAIAVWIVRKPVETEVSDDAPIEVEATAVAAPPPEPAPEPPPPIVQETRVAIYCVPACDEIKVDGEALDLKKDLRLPPGKYEVEVSKKGYVTQEDELVIAAGTTEDLEKTYELKATPVGNWKPPKEEKPCGQFLKRCD
jgi:eukaryotic-like serine/threonine-protein kinase